MANDKEKTLKVNVPLWVKAIPILGLGAGLFYAYKKKKSPLGYVGFGLLGGFVGSVIAAPFALKKAAKAIGDDLTSQMKEGVSKLSTPTSSSTTNTNATSSSNSSKRNSIIAELKKQSLQSDPTAEQPSDDFYKNYSDRELEVLLIISKMDKDGASMNKINSEAEARKITAKYGTTPEELGNVMTKMFENAFSSMGMGKKQTPTKK